MNTGGPAEDAEESEGDHEFLHGILSEKTVQERAFAATYSSTVVPEPKLPFFQMMYKDLTVRFVIVYAMPENAKQFAIADIERALDASRLQHRIAASVPLDDIVRANELVEGSRIRGAVVLTTD